MLIFYSKLSNIPIFSVLNFRIIITSKYIHKMRINKSHDKVIC